MFLLIGLDLPELVAGLRHSGIGLGTAIGYSLLITGVLVVARIVCSYGALIATLLFRPGVLPPAVSTGRRWLMPLLLGWTGRRGVVSLAAALSIPVALPNGLAFPQRELIVFVTFVVILLTLLVQGLTLPYLIRRSKLYDGLGGESEDAVKQRIRQGLKQHSHQFLHERYEAAPSSHAGLEVFLKQWEERAKAGGGSWLSEQTRALYIDLFASQRQYLAQLNRDPLIDEDLIRQQLYQLDLEEERLKLLG